jgi:mitochondrial fission protein ELM1
MTQQHPQGSNEHLLASAVSLPCWIVTDGKAGMESQCLGLAEAMGLEPVRRRVKLRTPWKQLSPHILRFGNALAMTGDSDPIAPPWPDVLIATGRHSVAASLAVRSASPRTFRIQIQNPGVRARLFDLVAAPAHDRLSGENVLSCRGALHRATPGRLASEAARFAPSYAHLPRPLVAVLVGGGGQYALGAPEITALTEKLRRLMAERGAGLLVTASRRTGAQNEALLRGALAGASAHVWDGSGDNPYFAFLGLADYIVVTADSINMASEACATGKPVYVVDLPGGSKKFRDFQDGLRAAGVTRRFEGSLEPWSYEPFNDAPAVAAEAWRRILSRTAGTELRPAR